jgi:hypothetical protein
MRPSEIEYWAHQVMDLVASGHAVEDGRVELKREWIEPEKAARQIAAHANAARGESILWLIGVDEKQGVIGVAHAEFSAWFNAAAACFESLPPSCADLNVPRDGRAISALLFDTTRAPFVVKNPRHGKVAGDVIAFEVPWRVGRQTRSARREDLLRLLVPAVHVPAIEWLEAQLAIAEHIPADAAAAQGSERRFAWRLWACAYAEPVGDVRLVMPLHRCEARVRLAGQTEQRNFTSLRLSPVRRMNLLSQSIDLVTDSHTIAGTSSEVILSGPGMLEMDADLQTGLPGQFDPAGVATIWVRLRASGVEKPIDAVLELEPDQSAEHEPGTRGVHWKLKAVAS